MGGGCICLGARRWAGPARSTACCMCAGIMAIMTSGGSGVVFRGTGGPLNVWAQPEKGELSKAVLAACVEAGIPANPDFNGVQQEGCGFYQTTTSNKRRWSAAKAYLSHPPSNLTIETNAHATRGI